jgi:hypothetical protein
MYNKLGHFIKIMACTYAWQIGSFYQNYGLQLSMMCHPIELGVVQTKYPLSLWIVAAKRKREREE